MPSKPRRRENLKTTSSAGTDYLTPGSSGGGHDIHTIVNASSGQPANPIEVEGFDQATLREYRRRNSGGSPG